MSSSLRFLVQIGSLLLAVVNLSAGSNGSTLNFPRMSFVENELTGITIFNPNRSAVQVTITLYNEQGEVIQGPRLNNPRSLIIFGGQQLARVVTDLMGRPEEDEVAWLQVTSLAEGLTGFFLIFDRALTYLDGADLPQASRELTFSEVRVSGGSATELNIVNPNQQSIGLTIRLLGQTEGFRQLALPALGVVRFDLDDFFDLSGVAGNAVVTVDATQPVVGFEWVQSGIETLGANGQPPAQFSNSLLFPQMAVGKGFNSLLNLSNLTAHEVSAEISAFQADGTLFSDEISAPNPLHVEIPSRQTESIDIGSQFGFGDDRLYTGWLQVATTAQLGGVLTYSVPATGALAAVQGTVEGTTEALFTHIATALGFFNGVALLNPSSLTTDVQIAALLPDGRLLGSTTISLGPGQRISKILQQLIPESSGQAGGLIWFESRRPIRATSVFGTNSTGVLANVPPQPRAGDYRPPDLPDTQRIEPQFAVLNGGGEIDFRVVGTPGTALWSVADVAGGNEAVGQIDSFGGYRAPEEITESRALKVEAVVRGSTAGATIDLINQEPVLLNRGNVLAIEALSEDAIVTAEFSSLVGAEVGPTPAGTLTSGTQLFLHQSGTSRLVASLAGEEVSDLAAPRDVEPAGLLVAGQATGTLWRLDLATEEILPLVEGLMEPASLALTAEGDLLVAESHRISRLAAALLNSSPDSPLGAGNLSTVADGIAAVGLAVDNCSGQLMATDEDGRLWSVPLNGELAQILMEVPAGGDLVALKRRHVPCPEATQLILAPQGMRDLLLVLPQSQTVLPWLDTERVRGIAVGPGGQLQLWIAERVGGGNARVNRVMLNRIYSSR